MNYDMIIKNAKIIDGTNTPWFIADIGIINEKIVRIGTIDDNNSCKICIKADGLVTTPGFIDSHTHYDLTPFSFYDSDDNTNNRRLMQGITTQIVGCCGLSPAPMSEASKPEWLDRTFGIKKPEIVPWTDFKGYLDALSSAKLSINYACYVGHGAIRHSVIGYADRKATSEEMIKMKQMLSDSIDSGAIGMSSGLIYAPGVFTKPEELMELCSVMSKSRAIYASHIRSENARWIESVAEVINICKKNNIPGIIHHLKTKAKDSKELVETVLKMIDDARKSGVDIVFEQYPYEASSTEMSIVLSSWMREGGKDKILIRIKDNRKFELMRDSIRKDYGWKNLQEEWEGARNMLVLSAENHDEYIGKTIYDIAKQLNKEPIRTVFDLLIETDLNSMGAFFGIKEEDICSILKNPYGMIGSDSDNCKTGETTHPRTSGTFPKIIGNYAVRKHIISLENAIYKMTGFPAARFNLPNRGLLKEGFFADIVIFEENKILDKATYINPFERPDGIEYVIVNGKIIIQKGERKNIYPGKVLKKII